MNNERNTIGRIMEEQPTSKELGGGDGIVQQIGKGGVEGRGPRS